jgi:Na+/proline symporter
MNNLHLFDMSVMAVYLCLCLAIGLMKMRDVKTIFQYAIGDGRISSGMLTATLFATHIGAGYTIGTVETFYSTGLIFIVTSIAAPFFWLVMSKIFANNIEKFRNAGCITISDVMEYLYGPTARWVTNICAAMMSISIVAMQVLAIGYLFEFFFGVSVKTGAMIGFSVLVLYSMLGGIKAVVLTDALQALILAIAIPAACFIGYNDIGGMDGIIANVPNTHKSIEWSRTNILAAFGWIAWTLIASYGSFVQRFLMTNNTQQLRKVFVSLFFLTIPFTITVSLIGFIVKAKAPDINPNTALYFLINQYLPIGIKGFVIAGVLAAIMSTADSWLNTVSVLFAHDIIKKIFPGLNDRQELNSARIALVLIALFASFMTFYHHESVLKLDLVACNFWDPIVYIPLAAGFLGYVVKPQSFNYSAIAGVICTIIGAYVSARLNHSSELLGFDAISLVMGIGGCWIVFIVTEASNRKSFSAADKAPFRPYGEYIREYLDRVRIFSLKKFAAFSKKQVSSYSENYYYLGIFGITYYLVSSLAFSLSGHFAEDLMLWLRVCALLLCFCLSVHEVYLPKRFIMKYMPVFWHLVLAYCLPFLSTYTFLVSDMSSPWMTNLILSEALLYVLAGGFIFYTASVLGMLAAVLLFYGLGYPVVQQVENYASILTLISLVSTFAIIYLISKQEDYRAREIKAKVVYGKSMAHEVKQPIASIYMASSIFEDLLKHEKVTELSQENFDTLKEIANSFRRTAQKSVNTVNMLLSVLREDVSNAFDNGIHSADSCVMSAINDYVLSDAERSRITVAHDNDFRFYGSLHFVKHVITNLLNNTLKYAGTNVSVEISYSDSSIHFKDYGTGIDYSKLQSIFKRLEDPESIPSSSGVGLAFCHDVMLKMGGNIACYSEKGKYTEIVLSFPSLNVEEKTSRWLT